MAIVNELKIGDVVRSYDFQGRTDCYFEGVVEIINGAMATFSARTTKQVFRGEELDLLTCSKAFTSDLPGMNWMDDIWENRIELVK